MNKRRLLTTCLMAGFMLTASAQEYYDITQHYISNPGFDTDFDYDINATGNVKGGTLSVPKGWTQDSQTKPLLAVGATFQFGTQATFLNLPIPATGFDGTANGGCLTLCAAYANQMTFYRKVMMPAGNYQLVVAYYNCNTAAEVGISTSGWKVSASEQVLSTLQTFGINEWRTDTISFTLTEPTSGHIQLGFKSPTGATAASAMLVIDFVKLLRDTPYGDIDDLVPAPTVVADPRFARGSTMAFGRIKSVKGEDIEERGFCWSEQPDPTVDDFTTTETLNNNGLIYWLKNLKPATKYYMRAYARTSTGKAGYSETIKFYTIPKGQVSFSMRTSGDANSERIKAAAQTAVNWWNDLTEMKGFNTSIGYESGTPTADCSYGGWMRVGPNTSYQKPGTIMHEMLHGVGVIPWADTEWSRHNLRSGVNGDGYGTGQWLGDRVTEVLRFWDNNTTSVLNGDYQHMWPYGINGANEDNGSDVLYIGNGLVCQALGEDGLQHTYSLFAEPYYALNQEDTIKYYLKNESAERGLFTSYLIPTSTGTLQWREMTSAQAAANDSTAWFITFTPSNQYYQFRNAKTGQYLTFSSGFKTMNRTSLTANENFHLMKGRVNVGAGTNAKRGYWIIHPTNNWTPSCMQANANKAISSATFNIANSAENQRWLILTREEMDEVEQAAIAAIKKEATDLLQPIKALINVPHTEKVENVDVEFNEAVSNCEEALNTVADITTVQNLYEKIKGMALWFLSNVKPTNNEQPFDLSFMIKNAGMDAVDGWSESPALNYSCAEFYQKTFNFNQSIDNLPAGDYKLMVQGFQRPGTTAASYADYVAGNNKVNATLYAGDKSEKIAHIARDAQDAKFNVGNESGAGTPTKYVPNNMQAAAHYFSKGLYDNSVECAVATNGSSLRIGLRSTSMPDSYWVIFDNFRLYYYGGDAEGAPNSINDVAERTAKSMNIYSLDGRLVRTNATSAQGLQPGIYILNGRKVFVK